MSANIDRRASSLDTGPTTSTVMHGIFTLASHAVMVWFLLLGGLSAFGVLVIAAGESLLVACIAIIVHAFSYRFPRDPSRKPWTWGSILADMVFRCVLLLVVFGGVMALFLSGIVFVAQPKESLGIFSPAFMETARYVALATAGHGVVHLVQVLWGDAGRMDHLQSSALAHLMIGTLVASFGAAFVLLMKLPTLTLVALIVLKTAADLAVDAFIRGHRSAAPASGAFDRE